MKKLLITIGIVLVLVVGWLSTLRGLKPADSSEQVAAYRAFASEQISLGAFGSALERLEQAAALEGTAERLIELALAYCTAGQTQRFKDTLADVIARFPGDAAAYEILAEYFHQAPDYAQCVKVLEQARSAGLVTDRMRELYRDSAYQFTEVVGGFSEAGCFYGGLAVVRRDGVAGLLNVNLQWPFGGMDEVMPFTGTIGGVVQDGAAYFIDRNGRKYMESATATYSRVYAMGDGRAVVEEDGRFGYVDDLCRPLWEGLEAATTFHSGLAAIRQNGAWTVVDRNGNAVGESTYLSVAVGEDNICSRGGVVFVWVQDEGYRLLLASGKYAGAEVFEDVRPFFDGSYAAVRQGGLWGFVNTSGEWVITPQYEDARSFCGELAPVKADGSWGYITTSNQMVIPPQFEDAKQFNWKLAPVMRDGMWLYIKQIV